MYAALRNGGVDLVLNDQRRAFSDEYVNFILTTSECYVEIATRNPLASLESIETDDLKNIPCILIASPEQQENERTYYQEIVGIKGDFLFAENLEEARLLVIGGKGFMPLRAEKRSQGLPQHFAGYCLPAKGNLSSGITAHFGKRIIRDITLRNLRIY